MGKKETNSGMFPKPMLKNMFLLSYRYTDTIILTDDDTFPFPDLICKPDIGDILCMADCIFDQC